MKKLQWKLLGLANWIAKLYNTIPGLCIVLVLFYIWLKFDIIKTKLYDFIVSLPAVLNKGARIAIISFHSLEDKICKNIFNSVSKVDDSLKHLPIIPNEYLPKFKVIKTIDPSESELEKNSRARSAKLRIIERIGR